VERSYCHFWAYVVHGEHLVPMGFVGISALSAGRSVQPKARTGTAASTSAPKKDMPLSR
jgi:hypothetical protein